MLSSLPAPLFFALNAFLASVALCGAFVWFYNRALCRMHESLIKKVMALVLLPGGCLLGLWVGWILTRDQATTAADPCDCPWLGYLPTWGAFICLAYGITGFQKWRLARPSTLERLPPFEPGINWAAMTGWRGVLLRILAPINGVTRLRIHRRELWIEDLPAAFDGYKIVHVTDFHIHKTLTFDWFDYVVDRANGEAPDLMLYGGDFISKPPHIPDIPRVMSRLSAPDGVWFVRGNHDFWRSPHRITRLARESGMRLLDNRAVTIARGAQAIALIGIEDPYVRLRPEDLRELSRGLPPVRIGMVHAPDAFVQAEALGCQVAIAGHTHGGQIRLPFFGTTISSTAAGSLVASGPGRVGDMLTITSNGAGAFMPLRVLCPPEMVVLTLRRGRE
ncbi:MAG: metallophosphoesterase [Sumerlaeia bacterium]